MVMKAYLVDNAFLLCQFNDFFTLYRIQHKGFLAENMNAPA